MSGTGRQGDVTVPVHFIVLPHVYLLDLAGVADALRNANEVTGTKAFDLRYHGAEPSVPSSLGIPLSSLEPLPASLTDGAWVIVAGVTPIGAMRGSAAATAVRWLARHVTPRQRLACICSGAFVAARAGLLDGRVCTTHHALCAALQREHPAALVRDNRVFAQDGHVTSSAGVTAGIDLALHLIAGQCGPEVAARVARNLVVYFRRAGGDAQLSPWFAHRNHLHPVVHRAQDAIVADPSHDWDLPSVAAVAATSVRHLSRLFRDEVGITVLGYLQHVRIAIARERLDRTALPIERIAEEAGFRSAHQFRRVWQRHEDGPPSAARRTSAPTS